MAKRYITVLFEYEEGAQLPLDLTAAFASKSRQYQDATITAVSLEDEFARLEAFEAADGE